MRPGGMPVAMLKPEGAPVLQRLGQLRNYGDPRQTVSGWARLCARLLGLGWAGAAYEPDNLIVPEGLKDLEPLVPLRELCQLSQAEAAIRASLESLARGVATYLAAPWELTLEPVRREVYQDCREQAEQGLLLPPPLLQDVLKRPAFDLIVDRLR